MYISIYGIVVCKQYFDLFCNALLDLYTTILFHVLSPQSMAITYRKWKQNCISFERYALSGVNCACNRQRSPGLEPGRMIRLLISSIRQRSVTVKLRQTRQWHELTVNRAYISDRKLEYIMKELFSNTDKNFKNCCQGLNKYRYLNLRLFHN